MSVRCLWFSQTVLLVWNASSFENVFLKGTMLTLLLKFVAYWCWNSPQYLKIHSFSKYCSWSYDLKVEVARGFFWFGTLACWVKKLRENAILRWKPSSGCALYVERFRNVFVFLLNLFISFFSSQGFHCSFESPVVWLAICILTPHFGIIIRISSSISQTDSERLKWTFYW